MNSNCPESHETKPQVEKREPIASHQPEEADNNIKGRNSDDSTRNQELKPLSSSSAMKSDDTIKSTDLEGQRNLIK
jgi:hypothetical protein